MTRTTGGMEPCARHRKMDDKGVAEGLRLCEGGQGDGVKNNWVH